MAELDALTPDDLDAAAGSDVPLLVDFWAPWCGSCRLLMPTVATLADSLRGQVRVGKLDVDAHPEVAERLGVRGVPTLVLTRSGQEVARVSGVKSRAALTTWLDDSLAATS